MANEATLVINAEIKQALNDLKKFQKTATTSMKASEKSVSALEKGFGGLKTTILAVGGAFAAFSGVKAAVGQLGDFSKGLSEIKSIADDSVKSNKNLGKELLKVANTFGTGATQQTSAFYSILSAGITDANKANKALVASNKLAIGGLASVEQSVDILTSSLNVYKKEGLSAEKASDILFATVKKGKTTVSELASSMGTVLPPAQALGVGFDEVGGALATMTAGGIATAQATTGLKAVFNSVVLAQSKLKGESSEVAEAFDLNSFRTKGLSGALKGMVDSVGGSTVELTRLLGSSEAVIAVQSLMRNGFNDLNDSLDATKNSTGAADAAFKEMQESLGKQLSDAVQNVKNFALAVSLNFEGVIGEVLKGFNKAVKESVDFMLRLSDALGATEKISFKKIAGGITSIGVAVGGLIAILKGKQALTAFKSLSDFAKAKKIVQFKKLAQSLKTTALAGLKFTAMAVAIVAAAIGIDLLVRNFGKLTNIVTGAVLGGLVNLQQKFVELQVGALSLLDSFGLYDKADEKIFSLSKELDALDDQLKEIDNTIATEIEGGFDLGLIGQVIEFKDAITGALEDPKELNINTKKVTEDITKAVSSVNIALPTGPGSQGPEIPKELLDKRNKEDSDAEKKEADRVSSIQTGIISDVAQSVLQGPEGAKSAISSTLGGLGDLAIPGFGGAIGGIAGELTKGPEHVKGMVDGFVDALPGLLDAFIDAVPVLIDALIDALPTVIDAILAAIPALIRAIVDAFPDIIDALIDAIPLVIDAIIDNLPAIIEAIIVAIPQIIFALVKAAPKLIATLISQIPKITLALAIQVPKALAKALGGQLFKLNFDGKKLNKILSDIGAKIKGFFTGLLQLPAKFLSLIGSGLRKIIDKLNPVSGAKKAGKKTANFVNDVFGTDFAVGGTVPQGFPDDTFNANLTSGELVVPRDDVSKLRSFLDNQKQESNDGGINAALLSQVVELLGQPMQVQTTAEVDGEALANIMLDLSRQNARVA